MEAIEQQFPAAEMERMMKAQEVILKATGREAEVVGSRRDYGRDGPHDAALARAAATNTATAVCGTTANAARARSGCR